MAKIIPGDEWLWFLEPPGMESPSAGETPLHHTPPHSSAPPGQPQRAQPGWKLFQGGKKQLQRGPQHLGSCQKDEGSPKDAPAALGPT